MGNGPGGEISLQVLPVSRSLYCSGSVRYGFCTGGLGRRKVACLLINEANYSLPEVGKADVKRLSNNVKDVITLFVALFG